jgi:aminopeptidase 2
VFSLDVNENTSKFDFHLSSLNLGSVSLSANLLHVQQVDVTMAFDEKAERVILLMDTLLLAGSKAQLHIAFHGELTDGLMGYYRSAYKVNGTDKYYSLTQLAVSALLYAYSTLIMLTLNIADSCAPRVPLLG